MELNFSTPVNNLSYGITGLNLLKQLDAAGCKVSFFPIGTIGVTTENIELVKTTYANASSYKRTSPSLRLYHQFDLAHHVGKGMHVGFPIFELDTFKEREKTHVSNQDVVIVCSDWARDVVIDQTKLNPGRVHVVPLGVDRTIFHPDVTPLAHRDAFKKPDTTIFINVGKFEVRKGHADLIDAFNEAFKHDDNVQLWILGYNPFLISEGKDKNAEWATMCSSSKLADKIILFQRMNTQQEIATIMAHAHVGVFPSKAEGWNLPLLELMSMGKHCIATANTAHTMYANGNNCTLINTPDKELAFDGIWFTGQGNWHTFGETQKKELVEHLRYFYELHQSGNLEQNVAGIETAKVFSWEASASKLMDILKTFGN